MAQPHQHRTNTERARDLRNNPTEAERTLWHALSNRKVGGVRFNGQVSVGSYICDFVARTPRLIVEVDGGQHAIEREKDDARTLWLEMQGYHLVRFWNHDVLNNVDGVVLEIEAVLSALPQPLPRAGGGRKA